MSKIVMFEDDGRRFLEMVTLGELLDRCPERSKQAWDRAFDYIVDRAICNVVIEQGDHSAEMVEEVTQKLVNK